MSPALFELTPHPHGPNSGHMSTCPEQLYWQKAAFVRDHERDYKKKKKERKIHIIHIYYEVEGLAHLLATCILCTVHATVA